MEDDKRTGQPPIPDNLEDWLNDIQLEMLRKIEILGFTLIFMRRPVRQDPVPIVINNEGTKEQTRTQVETLWNEISAGR